MFTLKINPNTFYIGRAKDLQKRIKSHFNVNLNDRFHMFAKTIGWDKFNFSVIEICDLNMQKEREIFYLQKYLPLLNTIFKSNMSTVQNFDSLYEILKLRQSVLNIENKYKGINIYLYEYISSTKNLNISFKTFTSINELSNHLGIARETISVYLNTYVPFKNNLFLTDIIESIELVEKLVNDAILGLDLDRISSKNVWMYYLEKDGTVVKTHYESISKVAKLLNVQHLTINNHLDKWIKGGINGNYLFSYKLDSLELEKLKEISILRKYNNCKVWVYNASTLELIGDPFTSMQKAGESFNIDYRSILNNLDTELAIIKNGELVLLFSYELTKSQKESLLNNLKKKINVTVPVWVYKKVNDNFVLINNNKPTYISKLEASKDLKISPKTLSKYLDSDKEYKGFYFYSIAL